jgi:outer membrane murein-binding lipoprotein Lpp
VTDLRAEVEQLIADQVELRQQLRASEEEA